MHLYTCNQLRCIQARIKWLLAQFNSQFMHRDPKTEENYRGLLRRPYVCYGFKILSKLHQEVLSNALRCRDM